MPGTAALARPVHSKPRPGKQSVKMLILVIPRPEQRELDKLCAHLTSMLLTQDLLLAMLAMKTQMVVVDHRRVFATMAIMELHRPLHVLPVLLVDTN